MSVFPGASVTGIQSTAMAVSGSVSPLRMNPCPTVSFGTQGSSARVPQSAKIALSGGEVAPPRKLPWEITLGLDRLSKACQKSGISLSESMVAVVMACWPARMGAPSLSPHMVSSITRKPT